MGISITATHQVETENKQMGITMTLASFDGTWKLSDSDTANFEKYMAALGVGWATRKIGAKMGRTITFKSSDASGFHIISESTLKTTEKDIELGNEIEGVRDDGVKVFTKFTFEDGCLVQHERTQDGKLSYQHKWVIVNENSFEMHLALGDVKVCQVYTKQ